MISAIPQPITDKPDVPKHIAPPDPKQFIKIHFDGGGTRSISIVNGNSLLNEVYIENISKRPIRVILSVTESVLRSRTYKKTMIIAPTSRQFLDCSFINYSGKGSLSGVRLHVSVSKAEYILN